MNDFRIINITCNGFFGEDKSTYYSRTHCNYLFFKLKVLTTILLPFYFITASARNFVYPLKNYTGELYCYVYEYSLLYGLVVYQHLSLFINLFRYICIVHGNTLMSHGISMKVSTYTQFFVCFSFRATLDFTLLMPWSMS